MGDSKVKQFLTFAPWSTDPSTTELWGTIVASIFGGYLSSFGLKEKETHMLVTFAATMSALPFSNWIRSIYNIVWFVFYQNVFSLCYSYVLAKALGRPLSSIARDHLIVATFLDAALISAFQYARLMGLQAQKIISSYQVESNGSVLTPGGITYKVVQRPVEEVKL